MKNGLTAVIGGFLAFVGACAIVLALFGFPLTEPLHTVHAQSNFCDQSIAIDVAAAATQTIIAGLNGATVHVCGFVLTGDTIATTGQFKSGTTALTGAMRMCDECNISIGNSTGVLLETPRDGNLTITAATGAITGFVRLGRN